MYQCNHCNEIFVKASIAHRHIKKHNKNKKTNKFLLRIEHKIYSFRNKIKKFIELE